MSEVIYRELKPEEVPVLADKFGDYITRFDCVRFEEGCYCLAAFEGETPVGFISVQAQQLRPPLSGERDAFISAIEVDVAYRRRGIARQMIATAEEWARGQGFRQLRSWSSEDKEAAISMWYALGFCVCPALMLGPDLAPDGSGRPPAGYYVARIL
jgi:GNAT superfamily N-acetyltransferase